MANQCPPDMWTCLVEPGKDWLVAVESNTWEQVLEGVFMYNTYIIIYIYTEFSYIYIYIY